MARTARTIGWSDPTFGWLTEEDTLLCGVSSSQGVHWTPVPSWCCEISVLYDGGRYLGCALRQRNNTRWQAIPLAIDPPSQVVFTGSMFEVMAWMEDHVQQV